nr:MAG TPA: HNH endonuclease [Caudoviricetes sp.]
MKGDKKKGDSEESPNEKERVDEFVNEWCRLYRETSQACEQRQQSRHMIYNNTRRDKRAAEFYVSKEWRAMRERIIEVYDNVDIYALYVENELLTCEPVHHIVELEDDWEQRLNPFNLIPLNHKTHNTITALYKQSKASMRATQKQLRSLIEYHFREAGGYKKVLCDSFLVAPPLLFGENSPREFQQKGTSERGVRM